MISRTFTLILVIILGINIIETSAGNGFYKGYVIQSVMNKARKRNRTMPVIKKICQTKILNISTDKTIITEKCVEPKLYLTAKQKMIESIIILSILTLVISACCCMNDRDREELFDMWIGMSVANLVDSIFDDD